MSNFIVKTETFDEQNIEFLTNSDSNNFENRQIKTENEDVGYSDEQEDGKKKKCKKNCRKCLKRKLKKQRKKERRKMKKFFGCSHHENCNKNKNSFKRFHPNWQLFSFEDSNKNQDFRR